MLAGILRYEYLQHNYYVARRLQLARCSHKFNLIYNLFHLLNLVLQEASFEVAMVLVVIERATFLCHEFGFLLILVP